MIARATVLAAPPIDLGGYVHTGLLTLAIVVASASLGFWLGRRALRRKSVAQPGAATISALLGLLAIFLAFTFGAAAARRTDRNQLVLDEANAIGTAELRSRLLPPEQAAEVHALLSEFVDLRVDVANRVRTIEEMTPRFAEIQERLWAIGSAALSANPTSHVGALFVSALNTVFDIHSSRVSVGVHLRIPTAIWVTLYLLTAMALITVGYEAGMGRSQQFIPLLMLILAFSTVVVLIADLDQPGAGFLTTRQQPLEDLQRALHAPR
jgi:hypothetical protein